MSESNRVRNAISVPVSNLAHEWSVEVKVKAILQVVSDWLGLDGGQVRAPSAQPFNDVCQLHKQINKYKSA